MKHLKTILFATSILLLAIGCNKTSSVDTNTVSNVNEQNQTNQPTNNSNENVVDLSTYKVRLDKTDLHTVTTVPSTYFPVQNGFAANGTNILPLYLDPTIYQGTNLESAWFNLAINSLLNSKECYTKEGNSNLQTDYNQKRSVQGNDWQYAAPNPLSDAGAGHQGSVETYRLFKNNICYEVKLGISKYNRENLENPNSVTEVDTTKILNYLGAIFNKLEVK